MTKDRTGCTELLIDLQIYFDKCDGLLLVLVADPQVLRNITYDLIKHLCRTLDFASNLLAHIVCDTLRLESFCGTLYYPLLRPIHPITYKLP